MRKWAVLTTAILSEVAAALALKAALDRPVWYLLVVAGYVAAFAMLTVCLRLGMAIGVAYGIWGAGGVTLTALASAALFGEPLTWLMGVGVVLIVAGVLTVELGSQRAQRERAEVAR